MRIVPRRPPSAPWRYSAHRSPRPGGEPRWRSGVSGTATPGRCGRPGKEPDAAGQMGRCGRRAPCAGSAELEPAPVYRGVGSGLILSSLRSVHHHRGVLQSSGAANRRKRWQEGGAERFSSGARRHAAFPRGRGTGNGRLLPSSPYP